MTIYQSALADPQFANIAQHLELAADHNPHLPRFLNDTVTGPRERFTFVTEAQMWTYVDHGTILAVGPIVPADDPAFVRRDVWIAGRAAIAEYPAVTP